MSEGTLSLSVGVMRLMKRLMGHMMSLMALFFRFIDFYVEVLDAENLN